MNNSEPDLEKLWQSIEPSTQPDPKKLAEIARKQKRKNQLLLTFDIIGNIAILAVMYFVYEQGKDFIWYIWLAIALLFSMYYTREFYVTRKRALETLQESTSNYPAYLTQLADYHMRVGDWMLKSIYVAIPSMIAIIGYQELFTDEPIMTSTKKWIFIVGWTSFWTAACVGYGIYKKKLGKRILNSVEKETGSE